MLGAIYGDIIGSYYEVHSTKDYSFPLNKYSTFTDDSVLIAAVCKTILNNPAEIPVWKLSARAKEFAAQYRQFYSYFPYAGFGNMFMAWADNPYAPDGDADTHACIAGGIAEAFYGEIPEHIKRFCESKLDITIKTPAREFEKKYIQLRKKR